MLVKHSLAELTESHRRRQLLVSVWLHEQSEGLARYVGGVGPRDDTNAVRCCEQLLSCSDLEGLSGLESQAIDRYGDFGKLSSPGTDIEPGL